MCPFFDSSFSRFHTQYHTFGVSSCCGFFLDFLDGKLLMIYMNASCFHIVGFVSKLTLGFLFQAWYKWVIVRSPIVHINPESRGIMGLREQMIKCNPRECWAEFNNVSSISGNPVEDSSLWIPCNVEKVKTGQVTKGHVTGCIDGVSLCIPVVPFVYYFFCFAGITMEC